MEIGWKVTSSNFGLYRQPAVKGGRSPTWLVRRDVPADLRFRARADGSRFGRVLKASTGAADPRVARITAERLWDQWGAEFAQARASGSGPILTVDGAQVALARWRAQECASAGEMAFPPRSAPTIAGRWPAPASSGSIMPASSP